jgi:hypothetical protein
MLALAAAALLAFGVPGDAATASYGGGALALSLSYEMTCGRPGPGPLVVRLPARFRLGASARTLVNGAPQLHVVNGPTLTIDLPKPPQITCMSIAEGTLHLRVAGVRAPRGLWLVRARIGNHAFAARVQVA